MTEEPKIGDYRIKQTADNCFVVEQCEPSTQGALFYWRSVGSDRFSPRPIEYSSLDSARKWIADQKKYPIYHEPE